MADVRPALSVMPIVATFSRYVDALNWGQRECARRWGDVVVVSPDISFQETRYYESSMGDGLLMRLLGCGNLVDPGNLALMKTETNRLELEFSSYAGRPERRPLNMDPGYLTMGKFVLASTKDGSHRMYIGHGIFAEITLVYRDGEWLNQEWTYPNYKREDYKEFLNQCRSWYDQATLPK